MDDASNDPAPETVPAARWARYDASVRGLTEYWYPVAVASTLRRKRKIAQRLVGQDLLLVHDRGRFHAVLDRCPHREIPLSLGSLEFPGHVSCVYHGWTFDLASGRLAAALSDGPDSPVVGKVCLRTFPVEERCGLIWVWMGSGKPVPVEEDIPEELLKSDARIWPLFRIIAGNWRYAGENGFDEAHGKTLHRSALWTKFRGIAAWNITRIKASQDGRWLDRYQEAVHPQDDYPGIGTWPKQHFWQRRKTGQRTMYGQGDHYVSVRLPNILRVKMPGNSDWTHYDWYSPVDEHSYLYLALAVSWRPKGWKSWVWALRFWTYIIWIHHYLFNGQDFHMVRSMPETAPSRMFRPDVSIFAWRKLVEDYARAPNQPTRMLPPDTDFAATERRERALESA